MIVHKKSILKDKLHKKNTKENTRKLYGAVLNENLNYAKS